MAETVLTNIQQCDSSAFGLTEFFIRMDKTEWGGRGGRNKELRATHTWWEGQHTSDHSNTQTFKERAWCGIYPLLMCSRPVDRCALSDWSPVGGGGCCFASSVPPPCHREPLNHLLLSSIISDLSLFFQSSYFHLCRSLFSYFMTLSHTHSLPRSTGGENEEDIYQALENLLYKCCLFYSLQLFVCLVFAPMWPQPPQNRKKQKKNTHVIQLWVILSCAFTVCPSVLSVILTL